MGLTYDPVCFPSLNGRVPPQRLLSASPICRKLCLDLPYSLQLFTRSPMMAEVVGLVAAGAQLLELTFEVISLVKGLIAEVRDELGSGEWQLSQAKTLLKLVRDIQQDSSPIIEEPLKSCLGELQLVHRKLVEVSAGSRQGRLNRLMMAAKFKAQEKAITAAWKRMEAKIQILSLALQWKSSLAVDGISKHTTSDTTLSRCTPAVRTSTLKKHNPHAATDNVSRDRLHSHILQSTIVKSRL